MSRKQIERQIWMMNDFIRQMHDSHEIAKIQEIIKDAAEGGVTAVDPAPAPAPAKPAITRTRAVRSRLASIAEESHESDADEDTRRK